MVKIVNFYNNEEMIVAARVLIAESFILIAKNIGLRKLFFKRDTLNSVMNCALRVAEEIEKTRPAQIL